MRAFVSPYMLVIDRNIANGPILMLLFTATHRDKVNAKMYAPDMAAPQTDAYLALRVIMIDFVCIQICITIY